LKPTALRVPTLTKNIAASPATTTRTHATVGP
jgi:hypothetical protein